jgi:hypothetical protein
MREITTFIVTQCDSVMIKDDYIQHTGLEEANFEYPDSYYEKDSTG